MAINLCFSYLEWTSERHYFGRTLRSTWKQKIDTQLPAQSSSGTEYIVWMLSTLCWLLPQNWSYFQILILKLQLSKRQMERSYYCGSGEGGKGALCLSNRAAKLAWAPKRRGERGMGLGETKKRKKASNKQKCHQAALYLSILHLYCSSACEYRLQVLWGRDRTCLCKALRTTTP